MILICSDIHANVEALTAVLSAAQALGVKRRYCLGDIVGYGPDPRDCVDAVMKFDVVVKGNHDHGVLQSKTTTGFNNRALAAVNWTRDELLLHDPKFERLRFLAALNTEVRENDWLFVHASPRDPLNEYLNIDAVQVPGTMRDVFARFNSLCFVGHTHEPGVIIPDGSRFRFIPQAQLNGPVKIVPGEKVVVNVGSVGQPRDLDKRACFVTVEGDEITFHRVNYNVAETKRKIRAIKELDDSLADRL